MWSEKLPDELIARGRQCKIDSQELNLEANSPVYGHLSAEEL